MKEIINRDWVDYEVVRFLKNVGAVLDGHFVLKSGLHSGQYVNKDVLYKHSGLLGTIGMQMAVPFSDFDIDVVVGPAVGGIL